MRQGQQNRRGRGRGRNKSQNPLSRNYESNGPDVKIRGTAAHIAEKYASLARDALSSGDTVAGESYLQHAEHYNRIIMASQPQQQPEGLNGSGAERSQAESSPEEADGKQPEAKQVAKKVEKAEKAEKAEKPEKAAKASAGNSDDDATSDDGLLRTLSRSTKGNGKAAAASDADSADSDKPIEVEEPAKKSGGDEASDEAVT